MPQPQRKRYVPQSQSYKAIGPDDVWACDITADEDENGRRLEWFAAVDEFTRECVLLDVSRVWHSPQIVASLDAVVKRFRAPATLRTDNNTLWRSATVREWLTGKGIGPRMIRRGSPWENGHIESFFGRLRNELLVRVEFTSVRDAQFQASRWREEYNLVRPHGALGYVPPASFRQSYFIGEV